MEHEIVRSVAAAQKDAQAADALVRQDLPFICLLYTSLGSWRMNHRKRI